MTYSPRMVMMASGVGLIVGGGSWWLTNMFFPEDSNADTPDIPLQEPVPERTYRDEVNTVVLMSPSAKSADYTTPRVNPIPEPETLGPVEPDSSIETETETLGPVEPDSSIEAEPETPINPSIDYEQDSPVNYDPPSDNEVEPDESDSSDTPDQKGESISPGVESDVTEPEPMDESDVPDPDPITSPEPDVESVVTEPGPANEPEPEPVVPEPEPVVPEPEPVVPEPAHDEPSESPPIVSTRQGGTRKLLKRVNKSKNSKRK